MVKEAKVVDDLSNDAEPLLALVGARIRSIRKSAKLKQSEIAKLIGTGQSFVVSVEAGEANVTLKVLARIASALGVAPAVLLFASLLYQIQASMPPKLSGNQSTEGSQQPEEDYNAIFGQNLRLARQRRGLTQTEFASEGDLTQQYVQRVEAGQGNLTLDSMKRLAKLAEQDLRDMLLLHF